MNNVKVNISDYVAWVTIDREPQLNALNKAVISELSQTIESLSGNDEVRVVVLTGAGEKAFVAGADIKEFAEFSTEEGTQLSRTGHEILFDQIASFPKPVIAAINGYALGGGLELALACHIRIASKSAKLGLPEVTLGLIPGYGGTQRLAEIAGKAVAYELITSAEMVDAARAEALGIVNQVTAPEDLQSHVEKLANQIAKNSPVAVSKAIQAIQGAGSERGYAQEIELFGSLFGSADFKEGVAAFLEKRKPKF